MDSPETCTYMTHGAVMPFCKGCGHSNILKKLNDALVSLQLDTMDVCLVTDIGCIGLADALFDKIHTVHTTHGRSTGFATGIAVADKVLASGKLKTIVLIGDGGSMIGLLHIVNAALMNCDVTVIVANNFLFGMTGGQTSSLTPEHFITNTSPFGSIYPALDICKIADASKAGFIARKIATDSDLSDVFAQAIAFNGFAIIEVLELCTEYGTKYNKIKGSTLKELAVAEGHKLGILKNSEARPEFSIKYKSDFSEHINQFIAPKIINPKFTHNLNKKISIIISGSAGEKVQSSAALLAESALNCGLNVTQKNDNPVTQGSGFSLSELILSPIEINYTAAACADFVLVLSENGLKEIISQNIFNRIDDKTIFITDQSVLIDKQNLNIISLPFRNLCGAEKAALGAIDFLIKKNDLIPYESFKNLMEKKFGNYNKIFKPEFYLM
jgi:pyruvate/2-oxoacid:ferredoxin oxidoreductase beta subunit/Pyruvate/2-oxoacid:ferredoxin oxidoreductase gamma subunit